MTASDQKSQIARYCRNHGSITVRECQRKLNINNATARISEMRRDPRWIVEVEDVPVYDEDGKRRTHYARYYIREVKHEQSQNLRPAQQGQAE